MNCGRRASGGQGFIAYPWELLPPHGGRKHSQRVRFARSFHTRSNDRHPSKPADAPRLRGCNSRLFAAWNFFWLFMATSSIHGFNHLTTRRRHVCEYVFWAVVLALGLYGALAIGLSTWHRYQDNPTVLSMDRDAERFSTNMAAALMCPTLKVDPDWLDELLQTRPDDKEFEKFITALFNASYSSFHAFHDIQNDYKDFLKPENYQDFVFKNAFPFEYYISNSFSDEELKEKGQNVPVMWTLLTEIGVCYAYNTAVAPYLDPQYWAGNVTPPSDLPVVFSYKAGGDIFLQLMNMNSPSIFFLIGAEEVADSGTRKNHLEDLTIPRYSLEALAIVTSAEARALSVSQRRCRYPDESDLQLSPVYAYGICRMECRMRLAYSLCRCVPYFYKALGQYEVCDLEGMRCLANHEEELVRLLDSNKKKLKCNCLQVCDTVNYMLEITSSNEWFLGTTLMFSLKFPKMRIIRDVIFGLTDVLVSVGGTAGFFLGCSCLSLIEIFYFFTLRLFWYVYKNVKTKTGK